MIKFPAERRGFFVFIPNLKSSAVAGSIYTKITILMKLQDARVVSLATLYFIYYYYLCSTKLKTTLLTTKNKNNYGNSRRYY